MVLWVLIGFFCLRHGSEETQGEEYAAGKLELDRGGLDVQESVSEDLIFITKLTIRLICSITLREVVFILTEGS